MPAPRRGGDGAGDRLPGVGGVVGVVPGRPGVGVRVAADPRDVQRPGVLQLRGQGARPVEGRPLEDGRPAGGQAQDAPPGSPGGQGYQGVAGSEATLQGVAAVRPPGGAPGGVPEGEGQRRPVPARGPAPEGVLGSTDARGALGQVGVEAHGPPHGVGPAGEGPGDGPGEVLLGGDVAVLVLPVLPAPQAPELARVLARAGEQERDPAVGGAQAAVRPPGGGEAEGPVQVRAEARQQRRVVPGERGVGLRPGAGVAGGEPLARGRAGRVLLPGRLQDQPAQQVGVGVGVGVPHGPSLPSPRRAGVPDARLRTPSRRSRTSGTASARAPAARS